MSPFVILRRSVQLLVALILFAPSAVRAQQTFTTFQAAGVVAGQANFTNQVTTASQTVTPGPTSVAISTTGKMAVGEQSGNRALIWNSIPATNGAAANVVVGQVNFTTTTGGVTASLTSFVEGVTFSPDGSKLIVCDAGNNRVLIWNSVPTTNGQPADVVIGQTNFTTSTGGIAANKLSYPAGVLVTPDGKLVVTELFNNRVLIFNSIPTSNGASADVVIGQASMTTNSSGSGANQMARPWHCAYSSDGKLLVAEESNNRVLVFNTLPTTNGASANVVVGQTAFGVSTGGTTSSKLLTPIGVAVSSAGQLSIGEFSNNRVLIYNTIPTSSGAVADVVLGQPNFTSNTSFNGGVGAQSMSRIYQLAYAADGRLLASGRDMRRVMIFAGTPSGGPPVVTTSAAGSVTDTGAMLNGTVNPNGLATTGFFRYGTDPTLTVGTNTAGQALGSENSAVAVAQAVSGLLPLTTYYFRASATNSAGTTNGGILSFTTLATPPTVVTLPATGLVPTGALLNGTVNPNGGITDVRFQYSTDPGLAGATLTPLQNIGAGIAAVPVSAALTGLVPKTTYYFRAVGTNSGGTVNGAILSFTTNVVNWGGAGSDPTAGILDPTLIPTSGTRTFTNVNGQGYNIVVTSSNLNAGGGASYFGDSGWWFEGGGPSYDMARSRSAFTARSPAIPIRFPGSISACSTRKPTSAFAASDTGTRATVLSASPTAPEGSLSATPRSTTPRMGATTTAPRSRVAISSVNGSNSISRTSP